MRRRAGEIAPSLRPNVLFAASLERIQEAEALLDWRRWSLSMYAAGLAVETLLQAIALRAGAEHDARHDLRVWLTKCPAPLVDAVNRTARPEWSHINAAWSNSIRYLSAEGLMSHLRAHKLHYGIKTGREGPAAILRVNARSLLAAAQTVHAKGIAQWHANFPR